MNFLSWVILIAVILGFVAVLWTMLRKKKRGEPACGSCSGCPMKGTCGKKKE